MLEWPASCYKTLSELVGKIIWFELIREFHPLDQSIGVTGWNWATPRANRSLWHQGGIIHPSWLVCVRLWCYQGKDVQTGEFRVTLLQLGASRLRGRIAISCILGSNPATNWVTRLILSNHSGHILPVCSAGFLLLRHLLMLKWQTTLIHLCHFQAKQTCSSDKELH